MLAVYRYLCYFLILEFYSQGLTSKETEHEHSWSGCIRSHSEITCRHIPRDIPDGITSVRLINVDGKKYPGRVLRNGTFSSVNWGYVEKLEILADRDWTSDHDTLRTFGSYCFSGLEHLQTLRISITKDIDFTPQTLSGIRKLKLLDLSGCRRFDINNLIDALSGPDLVQELQALNISLFNTFREGIELTDKFFKIISEKQIKELDISAIQVTYMNVSSLAENCGSLEYINISRIMLNDYDTDHMYRSCLNVKYIDASYIVLPSAVIPDRGPQRSITSNRFIPLSLSWFLTGAFVNVEYINLSGLTPKQTVYILNNVTALILGASKFSLKTLILRDNNFERLDLKILMPDSSLQSIDLSSCKIQFLNPGVFSSSVLLKKIDVSNNQLNEMLIEDVGLFSKLFRNLTLLRYINVARNQLTGIPFDMFECNSELEEIDLSNNLISQVSFKTQTFRNIKFLNLAKNFIKILDDVSMTRLDSLAHTWNKTSNRKRKSFLALNGNPITCSKCDSLSFVKWLVRLEPVITDFAEIKCENEQSEEIYFGTKAVDAVQAICNKPKVILGACTGVATCVAVATILLFMIKRHRRRKQHALEMEDRVALIREGAESHEFVVFLSFSSKEDDFVYKHVLGPLNENLQKKIGDQRDLVCEGDRNFQLGRPIHDQISELLKKSSVVVVVLTDNYCQSVHCRNEFDQAFMLEKPIVLMIKDEVNPSLMMPLIRDIYEKRTRILWKYENGEYVLKTSWENVCMSIIELVDST